MADRSLAICLAVIDGGKVKAELRCRRHRMPVRRTRGHRLNGHAIADVAFLQLASCSRRERISARSGSGSAHIAEFSVRSNRRVAYS